MYLGHGGNDSGLTINEDELTVPVSRQMIRVALGARSGPYGHNHLYGLTLDLLYQVSSSSEDTPVLRDGNYIM